MADKKTGASLTEFAGEMKRDCHWLSQQPEWDEIVDGYHKGIGGSTIRRWLIRERGYSDKVLPSADAISKYLRNNYSR